MKAYANYEINSVFEAVKCSKQFVLGKGTFRVKSSLKKAVWELWFRKIIPVLCITYYTVSIPYLRTSES